MKSIYTLQAIVALMLQFILPGAATVQHISGTLATAMSQ